MEVVSGAAPGVFLPHDTYQELLRTSKLYTQSHHGGILPSSDVYLQGRDVEKMTLVEFRCEAGLRQGRSIRHTGKPPPRLRCSQEVINAVIHVEQRRILIFKAADGTSRVVVQMSFIDSEGVKLQISVQSTPTGDIIVMSDSQRVIEIQCPPDDVAALYNTLVLRVASVDTLPRKSPRRVPSQKNSPSRVRSAQSAAINNDPRPRNTVLLPSMQVCFFCYCSLRFFFYSK